MLTTGEVNRREFLKASAALSVLPFILTRIAASGQSSAGGSIAVSTGADPSEIVSRAVDAIGGMERFVSTGDTVLIKPNASFSTAPETGANTNPEIASAVANLALQAGASEVLFADHPINQPGKVTLRINGLQKAATDSGAEFVIFSEKPDFESVRIEGGLVLGQVEIAKICQDVDVLVNLPVLKHHDATGSSVGMKNLMGLVYDRKAFHRLGLNSATADLSLNIHPDLTIVDATSVLATNGPRGPGQIVKLNSVVAGTDPVATDIASISLMSSLGYNGFDSSRHNRYLELAGRLGIGDADPESVNAKITRIQVEGEKEAQPQATPTRSKQNWVPYGSLSAASLAIGTMAFILGRRRRHG